MAYKPYKIQRNQDIYAKHDRKRAAANNNPYDGGVKLFGFRSGVSWKMIPALFYYSLMLLYMGTGIYGELRYYKFEPIDIVIFVLKYIMFFIWFFSPAIFLSDFKFRDKLPFFKKRETGASIIGIILVSMFCSFMIFVYKGVMSDTYYNSVKAYEKKLAEDRKRKQKNNESATEQSSDKKDETSSSGDTGESMTVGLGDSVSYNIEENIVYVKEV